MAPSSRSVADDERASLARLLAEVGPDAPTCCAGWTTSHLAAHLVVRDRRPDALPGFGVEQLGVARPLTAWAHRLEDRMRESTPYAEVVDRVRSGPAPWSPMAWPPVARVLNTTEFVIHHEDVRRAQPGWTVRELPRRTQDQLWTAAGMFARQVRGGVLLRRTDAAGAEKRIGSSDLTVAGEPLELLLWASGRRDVARVELS